MSAWINLAVTISITSIILVLLFNYRTRQVITRYRLRPNYAVGDAVFQRTMAGMLAAPFIDGNSIKTLVNGKEIFATMIEDIKRAKTSINLESFIFSSGKVSQEFIEALCERSQAGVKVNVLIDWIGSIDLRDEHGAQLKESGVRIVKYRKPHWYTLPRLNYRSHRKILVIDGRVGFTGGIGIADQWLYGRKGEPAWSDLHYRIEGPIVARMQAAFLDNWLKSHAKVLEGERYFPVLDSNGELTAQLFATSADGIEGVRLMYHASIAAAKKNVRIMNPYFVPDIGFIHTLINAAKRGVTVEVIVPGPYTDQRFLREVSRASWGKLLKAGVKIYEYQPAMQHAKLFIVDDVWVSIGSANCDGRSFAMNDEMNINILDHSFAQEQIALFEKDKQQSKPIVFHEWKKRAWWRKIIGNIGWLVEGQF